jgi:hypothetical protein
MGAKIICTCGSMADLCVCVRRVCVCVGGGLKRTHLNVLYMTICNRMQYFTFVQKSHFPSLLKVLISVNYYYHMLGPSWPWSYGRWIYNYLCNQCLSSLMLWVRISIRARCTTLCDKICQWLATGRWFSPVSSTNKTDRHDITEILLKVALNTIKQTISSLVNSYIWWTGFFLLNFLSPFKKWILTCVFVLMYSYDHCNVYFVYK